MTAVALPAVIQRERDRLEALIAESEIVASATKTVSYQSRSNRGIDMYGGMASPSPPTTITSLETQPLEEWLLSCETIVRRLAAKADHYITRFEAAAAHARNTHFPSTLQGIIGLLKSLLREIDGGHIGDIAATVRADLFSDLLDQARHLLDDQGALLPAAVIGGAVLEDKLRKLCAKHPSIQLGPRPTIDTLNSELARAGEYDKSVQKQVTAWAGIRNDAAHGKPEFKNRTEADIRRYLEGIEDFLQRHPD